MPVNTIPVIDIAPLVKGSPEQAHAVASALGSACREVGFFYISGHGVPPALIARVFETSAAFFAGPASIRDAASFSGPGGNRGYIRLGGETLDPGKPPDVKEAFNIGLELAADDPELRARARNLWPDMPGFRDTMLDYFNALWRLGRDLHRGFALDLGLEPDFFESRLDRPNATLRLLHYPPVTKALADGQLGAGAHTVRQRHPACDRCRRWADGSGSVGQVARRAGDARRLRLQHRRLPDAMVQRRLCFDTAQGG
jgi:isopenicillin N synthase-like dioxygenase